MSENKTNATEPTFKQKYAIEKTPESQSRLIHESLTRAARLKARTRKLEKLIKAWKTRLEKHQNARLITGVLFFLALVALSIRTDLKLELIAIAVFLVSFIWLVARTRRIQKHLLGLERLHEFYVRQTHRLLGQSTGSLWEDAQKTGKELSLIPDLGLLGSHSLWTLLDETLTDGGQKQLLNWMGSEPPALDVVLKRQKTIQSLRSEAWFYIRLVLIADRKEFRLSSSQILSFIKSSFVPAHFNQLFILIWMAWITAVGGLIASSHFGWGVGPFFMAGFAALSFYLLGGSGNSFGKGLGLAHHLSQLEPIFKKIEDRSEQSSLIRDLLPTVHASGPSRETRKVNFVLNFLGTQANPILHILINAVTPWTMTASFFLERRRQLISKSFPQCLDELSNLEALGSLAILDRFQTKTYPAMREAKMGREATAGAIELSFTDLFHPLIDRENVVANTFTFPSGKSLGLLTGSNMSGKSTFLRTLGTNQILANMGAPVFASTFASVPLRIETCIEVSDSLRDGFSYFYAEVRKLKSILQTASGTKPVLFLVDEIFRGTNNRERHIGSRAVIRALAKSTASLGFISTHDLELTQLEETHSSLLNMHFREDINPQGQMVFSYKLHLGPCPTTNALRIMASEGIDISGL